GGFLRARRRHRASGVRRVSFARFSHARSLPVGAGSTSLVDLVALVDFLDLAGRDAAGGWRSFDFTTASASIIGRRPARLARVAEMAGVLAQPRDAAWAPCKHGAAPCGARE
ncbi:hypothetical protein, partial [Paraburkholderia sp.]|uniref:hypothetical protein n=1 Tax=Paraburkholderia sp. TaxID=1926495 RepID=UPI00286F8AE0